MEHYKFDIDETSKMLMEYITSEDLKVLTEYCKKECRRRGIKEHKTEKMKCEHCKWLTGEIHSIGVECTNSNKKWKRSISSIRYITTPQCKEFEQGENHARERWNEYQRNKRKRG